ncbi:MAG TPA: RNA methyltransferase [Planctomycetaceae bacterium]|jgi:23S rRNA (guanosine2251-2'-O)-methyltransferase|nr:RNA methyltransferase [Planctomycetaceae bacterium]
MLTTVAVHLRNPHSVLAAFERRPEAVIDVRLPEGPASDAWREVEQLARTHRVPVVRGATHNERAGRRGQRETAGGRGGVAEATVKERPEVPLEVLFAVDVQEESAAEPRRHTSPRLWLALDQLQDPHNVGAIFRTAAFFGVAGILLTRDRSAPLNGTVYDVASGAMEVVPFSHPANLSRGLEIAKTAGLWVLGASEHASRDVGQVDRDRSWLLVLGNEERGLRRLTLDTCDETCRLSARGEIGSLNVSVAAGVLMSLLTSGGGRSH